MSQHDPLRARLLQALDWEEAHVSVPRAFAAVSPEHRGRVPSGAPASLWELLEHIRVAQHDLLEFCRTPSYEHPDWPAEFWPPDAEPPDERAWERSLERVHEDLESFRELLADPSLDLASPVPSGTRDQTHLRSALLLLDHNAYHVGQAVLVRRLLGIWPPA